VTDRCQDCGAQIGRGAGLCEGLYANDVDKTLCCMRQIANLQASLAAALKTVEAADSDLRPKIYGAPRYDADRAELARVMGTDAEEGRK
jgi:hypothetical protein